MCIRDSINTAGLKANPPDYRQHVQLYPTELCIRDRYMLVRLCKFTLAFVFLWMYAAFVGQQLKTFGFTLMLFYFIYLGLETYILYLFEKKRMKREKREKDDEYNQR